VGRKIWKNGIHRFDLGEIKPGWDLVEFNLKNGGGVVFVNY